MGKVFDALEKAGSAEELSRSRPTPSAPEGPKSGRKRKKQAKRPAREVPRPVAGNWDERLVNASITNAPVAESFRTLRTRILHPFEGDPPRSLLITSASPGEGKSFVCANLGVVLAQGVDQFALMVDCDLRKPTLHSLFGLPNDRGLVNFLRDRDDVGETILKAGVDKLSLIPAGPPPLNPSELLGSVTMGRLVDELVSRYDDRIILFDSPPMRAASETAILAQHVDGVILVVRWGGSRREYVQDLVDLIGRDKIVGLVFNAYKTNALEAKIFGSYEYQQKYYYAHGR